MESLECKRRYNGGAILQPVEWKRKQEEKSGQAVLTSISGSIAIPIVTTIEFPLISVHGTRLF